MKDLIGRVPLLAWFLVVTLILVAAGVFFVSKAGVGKPQDDSKPVPVAKSVEGTVEFPIVARNHIASGTSGSGYNSNPPTSGPHWPAPANKGIYDKELADEQAIHNLEHGYVWISYKSDVGDDIKNKLKEIVGRDDWKIIMAPREKDETNIALVAWGRLLKLDDLDEKRVKDFINTYRNRGPEKSPE